MYKNLMHNPMAATEDEIKLLNERRKREKDLILDKDKADGSTLIWFMVSSEWLYHWKCFISNRISQSLPPQLA